MRRSRARTIEQAQGIVAAAQRLIEVKGSAFTTQELSKEAGIALQTFYRHFPSKDHLLLAVLEDVISDRMAEMAAAASELPDPVARLRFYILAALRSLRAEDGGTARQFITSEHWRLYQIFPDEMAQVNMPFAGLIERELRAAAESGLLRPHDPAADAWMAVNLVTSVYHHFAYAPRENIEAVTEQLWTFCSTAFGGRPPDE
ncbi:TetR/AcrR family transcriptional regulator [Nocardia flavorosea]|uniref:TetR/AcrR family transcriptional regulator n=1 Tax=Nocardia flavorosea TaxID=53429 RepID=A0A846YIY7_9NOCA|nr:TetR/AcrR family transcriptional regulator [Nocardia flavorosea]NKY59077.1 TetR/AcrR family transcriptional regulator [Nocardia flavorosea]